MNSSNGINVTSSTSSNVVDDPNTRFSTPKYLGEWKFREDCQRFFEKYNKANNYEGLSLGDYITIWAEDKDHTYEWMVAGFDYYEESFGPGIVFIPTISIGNYIMNCIDDASKGYYGTQMDHYLKSEVFGSYSPIIIDNIVADPSDFSCCELMLPFTPFIQLMSNIQVYGKKFTKINKSEELEVIYEHDIKFDKDILPIFKFINPFEYIHFILDDQRYRYPCNLNFWLRDVASSTEFAFADGFFGDSYMSDASNSRGLRPLMYLR